MLKGLKLQMFATATRPVLCKHPRKCLTCTSTWKKCCSISMQSILISTRSLLTLTAQLPQLLSVYCLLFFLQFNDGCMCFVAHNHNLQIGSYGAIHHLPCKKCPVNYWKMWNCVFADKCFFQGKEGVCECVCVLFLLQNLYILHK